MQTITFLGDTTGEAPMLISRRWQHTRHLACRCGQCTDAPIPAQDWLVSKLEDRGPGEYYRYKVEGVNLNHPPCSMDRRFSWRVPSLCERFDLSAAIHTTL